MFAASDLKKRVEKENLTHQYGTKPAGAEAIVHIFQQVILQNPDYDVFSTDALFLLFCKTLGSINFITM